MESVKILLLSIAAAAAYGIVHDQFTARICLEYFTVFHPPIFATRSPTLLAIGWGVVATWWVGLFLGVLLTISARVGSHPKLTVSDLYKSIERLLLVMGACAFLSGLTGYVLSGRGVVAPPSWILGIPDSIRDRFMADWWAHNASYASGIFGGLTLCVMTYYKRSQLPRA